MSGEDWNSDYDEASGSPPLERQRAMDQIKQMIHIRDMESDIL